MTSVIPRARRTQKSLAAISVCTAALLVAACFPPQAAAAPRAGTRASAGVGGAAAASGAPVNPNTAYPDTALNAMFTDYADDSALGSHWTGGDATVSVKLPDGRDAWLFSDTYLGTVNSDGSRSPSTPFIHNDIVVQQGPVAHPVLTTLTGTSDGMPASLVGAPANGYRQVDSAWVDPAANKLYASYTDYLNPGTDGLGATPSATSIATFSLPGLSFQGLTTVPVPPGTLWGSAVLDSGGYTYVYGNGDDALYIARAPSGQVIAPGTNPAADWAYWTGAGWSPDEAAARPALAGLAGLTMAQVGSRYVLSAFDTVTAFDDNIVAYTSATPYGPFTSKAYLYSVPPLDCDCYSYYPQLHQELAAPGQLVLSYNSNSLSPADNDANASIYRPRFIAVPWPPKPVTASTGTPTGLTAVSDGLGVHLSWTAPSAAPTDYYVYAQDLTTGDSFPSRVGFTAQAGITLNDLTNSDTYRFTVTTFDGAAESAPSAPVTAVPDVAPPSQAPSGITATAGDDGTVTVSWSAVPNASWYVVQEKDETAGAASFTPSGLSTVVTDGVVSGLTVGHTYEFEVAAATAGGTGPYSVPATATSYEPPPPAPSGLAATANSDGTIGLTWNAVPGCWYFVQTSSDGGKTWTPPAGGTTIPDTTNSYQAEYLSIGTSYEFRVYATDAGGVGPASAVVSATARMDPPPAPANLVVRTNDAGDIDLSWTAPAPGLWYFVHYEDTSSAVPAWTSFLDKNLTAELKYLPLGHKIAVYVTATNAGGQGPATPVQYAVPYVPPPGVPANLTAVSENAEVNLSWTAIAGDWYLVHYRDVTKVGDGGGWNSYLVTTNSARVTYLTDGDHYQFYVTATSAGGVSAPSQIVDGWPQEPPPPAPAGLRLTANGDGTISFSWNAISGAWYWVSYRDATAGAAFTSYLDETSSGKLTFLKTGHVYQVYVTATNAGGLSPASGTEQVAARLAAPTGLDPCCVWTPGALGFQWTPGSSAETVFHVYWSGGGQSGNYLIFNQDNSYLYGLDNGQRYTVRVTAVGYGGGESPAVTMTATPDDPYRALTPAQQADEPPDFGQATDTPAEEELPWYLVWRPLHDTAVAMLAAEEQANNPTCVVQTENGIPGGSLNGNFGWADVVLWCAGLVQIWEVKHAGDGAEAAGPAQLAAYIDALRIALDDHGDARPVEAGKPLGVVLGPMEVPDGSGQLITVRDGASAGMIVYDVVDGPPPEPRPDPSPIPQPNPALLPEWVTSRPLWQGLALAAGGVAVGAIIYWVLNTLGVIVFA